MSNANGIITAPVSIDDVKTILGIASNDLATLCQSTKINMWARFKPVNYPSVIPLVDYQWIDCNFGIKNIPVWSSVKAMLSWIDNPSVENAPGNLAYNATMYQYDGPKGGMSSPYRLSDFLNYFHGSKSPIGPCLSNSVDEAKDNTFQISFDQAKHDTGHLQVRLSDLSNEHINFNQCYFGLAFEGGIGTYITTTNWMLTDDNLYPIFDPSNPDNRSGNALITVNDANNYLADKTWKVVPFASAVEIQGLVVPNNSAIVCSPFLSAISTLVINSKVSSNPIQQLLVAKENSDDTSVNVTYTITNNKSSYITVNSISISAIDAQQKVVGLWNATLGITNNRINSGASMNYWSDINISSPAITVTVTTVIDGSTFTSRSMVMKNN
jgi:hypothetical protein